MHTRVTFSNGLHRPFVLLDIFKFGAKDSIPETTCDTEAILVIGKVMLQVVLLELTVMEWEAALVSRASRYRRGDNLLSMMQEIMC